MANIHILSEHLTNMIAAGEVVERPANIVKECVENSLDAGASFVKIEVTEGGIEKLVITDDGCGMDSSDAWMAFQRHATSKISEEEDLFSITTMGFRGEALASIAAVSKVDLLTCNGEESTHIRYEYGEKILHEKSSSPVGTRIEITGLFLKTPARFKYLRKPPYEFSVIADLVNKLAVCHSDVRFLLVHNGRTVFQSTGSSNVQEVLYSIYGADVAKNAVPFQAENDDFSISGLAVQPKISRASKYFIFLSLNHRLIRSTQIQNAVLDAYREFLPNNRYPVAVLNIETDPQLVDVNVHPNKWEVRITKSGQLTELIQSTVSQLFSEKLETVSVKKKEPLFEQQKLTGKTPDPVISDRKEIAYPAGQKPGPERKTQEPAVLPMSSLQGRADFKDYSAGNGQRSREWNKEHSVLQIKEEPAPKVIFKAEETQISYPVPVSEPENTGHAFFEHLTLIGQLKESYILCENEKGLVIIDQHAAQERYNFERLSRQFAKKCTRTMQLMIPVCLKAPAGIAENLDAVNAATGWFGITFEMFGENEIICREVPLWFEDLDEEGFLQDILDYVLAGKNIDIEHMRRHMLATAACHASIRFHRHLSREEMQQVIENLKSCRQPYHCPHGRPTVITYSDVQLRKEFERG